MKIGERIAELEALIERYGKKATIAEVMQAEAIRLLCEDADGLALHIGISRKAISDCVKELGILWEK